MTWSPTNVERIRGVTRDCPHPRARHQHGTNRAYLADKCGCDACFLAHRRAAKTWRMYGTTAPTNPPLLPTRPAREAHQLIWRILSQTGMSQTRLAHECGWASASMIWQLTQRQTVTQDTIQRLRAVVTRHQVPPDNTPPPGRGEAARRLQALAVRGWSLTPIAARVGMSVGKLSEIRSGRRPYPQAVTVARIRDAYTNLMPHEGPAANDQKLQRIINSSGWLPAGAWENIIDGIIDPNWEGHRV